MGRSPGCCVVDLPSHLSGPAVNALLESKIISVSALLNLILDPLFIFGWLGFPKLGLQGAAVATLISVSIMLIFTIWHLHHHLNVFASFIAPIRDILDSWKHMLAIGIPAMITNAIIPVSAGIVVVMVAKYGVDAVAGFGIAMRLEPMALIPFLCLIRGLQSLFWPEFWRAKIRPTSGSTQGHHGGFAWGLVWYWQYSCVWLPSHWLPCSPTQQPYVRSPQTTSGSYPGVGELMELSCRSMPASMAQADHCRV